jgi:hypothetical protein
MSVGRNVAISLLLTAILAACDSDNHPVIQPTETQRHEQTGPRFWIGTTPQTDEGFIFSRPVVSCGSSSVIVFGPPKVVIKVQGQICTVDVVVKKESGTTRALPAQDQFLSAGGQKYPPLQKAALMRHNRLPFFKAMPAGVQARGSLYFDVPKGAAAEYVELHASSSSPGARIPLVLKE